MKSRHVVTAVTAGSISMAAFIAPKLAFAAGGTMPWDGPLATLGAALTGPTAASIALIAAFAAILGLAFGGEMSGWIRGVLVAAVGMALLVAVPTLATALGITVGGMVG